jgi:hypothetical protein
VTNVSSWNLQLDAQCDEPQMSGVSGCLCMRQYLLCVYVSVWICECVNVCVCIVVCVWEYVWVWGCVYVSVCVWVYVSVCGVFGCIVWMWLWLCECVYVCEYKCICLWVCLVLFKLCIGFTINIVLLPFWYDFKTVKIMFNFKIAILPNFF